jgi:hypothetical protein
MDATGPAMSFAMLQTALEVVKSILLTLGDFHIQLVDAAVRGTSDYRGGI